MILVLQDGETAMWFIYFCSLYQAYFSLSDPTEQRSTWHLEIMSSNPNDATASPGRVSKTAKLSELSEWEGWNYGLPCQSERLRHVEEGRWVYSSEGIQLCCDVVWGAVQHDVVASLVL